MSSSVRSHISSQLYESLTLDILQLSVPRGPTNRTGSEAYHAIRLGPSSWLGAALRSLERSSPMASTAFPVFCGRWRAIIRRIRAANLGPLPLVLTMICKGPSRWTLPK